MIPPRGAAGFALLGGGAAAAFTYNLTKANTARIRAAGLAMAANVPIVCWGDSIVRGQSTGGGLTQFARGWPRQLVAELRQRGFVAGGNNLFGSGGQWGLVATMANVETGDPRVTHTGAWAVGANITGGGLNYQSAAAGSMTFTPAEPVTKFDLWWRNNTTGRSFNRQIDAGATTQVDSTNVDAATEIAAIDAGGLGIHSITTNWVAGTPVVLGFNAYDDSNGRKELQIINWGHSGASSTTLAATTFTAAAGINMLPLLLPKLTIIEGGIGNSWRTSISIAQTKADLTAMIQSALTTGDVWLLDTPWDSSGSGLAAQQSDYVTMLYQLAREQGIPVLGIRKRPGWSSTADETANGFVSDTVHPTPLGYSDIASFIADVLTWAISGFVVPNIQAPPAGFIYLTGVDDAFLQGADGANLLGVAP